MHECRSDSRPCHCCHLCRRTNKENCFGARPNVVALLNSLGHRYGGWAVPLVLVDCLHLRNDKKTKGINVCRYGCIPFCQSAFDKRRKQVGGKLKCLSSIRLVTKKSPRVILMCINFRANATGGLFRLMLKHPNRTC